MIRAPDGYTEKWDNSIWNVGYVFWWSDFYGKWLDCDHRVTVKPGQTLIDAYPDGRVGLHSGEYGIFFYKE